MDYCSQMKDSVQYIEENLDSKISLEALAEKAHLSKYYYHRLFSRIMGESVTKYINRRRMEKASEELVQTAQPIIELALKYQYGSQEAFSRAFMRIYGMTPGKYRKSYMGGRGGDVTKSNYYFNKIMDMAA
ncbi:MAG TPA: helix-turn-helix transcriptional regulator [Clostridiales bacterium]|nr:helix-turn-helix transcriptional regulator [Clostridiales bacterium]